MALNGKVKWSLYEAQPTLMQLTRIEGRREYEVSIMTIESLIHLPSPNLTANWQIVSFCYSRTAWVHLTTVPVQYDEFAWKVTEMPPEAQPCDSTACWRHVATEDQNHHGPGNYGSTKPKSQKVRAQDIKTVRYWLAPSWMRYGKSGKNKCMGRRNALPVPVQEYLQLLQYGTGR